jgi:hypothetical protein
MRGQLVALVLLVGVALPTTSSAEDLKPSGHRQGDPPHTAAGGQSGLLQRLGINPIAKAHAAECKEEGETCTSNEQCCSGLECSGGPPAACMPED